MKKFVLLILLCLALCFITGCSKNDKAADETSLNQEQEQEEGAGNNQSVDDETLNNEQSDKTFVIEDMFSKSEDIPDVFRFDVTIPKIKDSVPNADKINNKIRSDYQEIMSADRSNYTELVTGFTYPVLNVKYEIYSFDGVYEICVLGEIYSAQGSGVSFWAMRYYYDTNIMDEISEEEFLSKLGYSKEKIVQAFYDEVVEDGDTGYTYEDFITFWYYIDQNKQCVFHSGLYS